MNHPLYFEDPFGNFARVVRVFKEEKIQEEMGGHAVSKCKEVKLEGISVTNFRFVEEIQNVSWP